MKKVLFIANTDRHIKLCHIPYLKMFKDNGYIVHVATNTNMKINYCDKKIDLNIKREPFSIKNFVAIFKFKKIIKKEHYDIISCHTPIGGFLGRVSTINLKNKPKVIYTAHGFHFFKNGSKVNWFIYYPIERFLSRFTTCIITMNNEDYNLARNKFHCPIYKINGIGLNDDRLKILYDKNQLKKELNLDGYYIVSYIAEISKRKNQLNLIKELNKYDLEKEKIKVLLVGDSIIHNFHKKINNANIIYIDFKETIGDYINISDLIVSSSTQEGLPLCILEAMVFNKPIIALNIRGNNDLIVNNENGFLVENVSDLVKKIIDYKNNECLKINNKISKYELSNVVIEVKSIYNKYLEDKLNEN